MDDDGQTTVHVLPRIAGIDAQEWDSCANPDPAFFNPFVSHAFLKALEDAGTVGGRSGWLPRHIVLRDREGSLLAAMPAYLKTHSLGEYVFDHAWADAFEQAGGRYYPKLQAAVPFTPVPGPRLLVRSGADAGQRQTLLAKAAVALARSSALSSVHITFLPEREARLAEAQGFLVRTGQQFHWRNRGYRTFEDFLSGLSSRKRKAIRHERRAAPAAGLTIEHVTGRALSEAHWDAFFAFYMDTGSRKWGQPYLNRRFFSLLGQAMADRCLLILARRGPRWIAGALNLIGGDCLYGRYWGAAEHHPFLHFELCYHQAIEWAIARGLARVEAGAQGEHKLARGYLPETTYSAHWIADPGFREAVARFLDAERQQADAERRLLLDLGPYRKNGSGA